MIEESMQPSILAGSAACWNIDPDSLEPLPGGHFAQVFGFTQNDRAYVLRITPPDSYVNLSATQAMLAFQNYLLAGGAAVPGPVPSRSGQFIERVPDPNHPHGPPFLATVFTRAQGALAEALPVEAWDAALIENIGQTVGRLHYLSRSYASPGAALERPHWQHGQNCFNPIAELAAAQDPTSPHHWLLAHRAAVLDEIECLPKTSDVYAIIHADLHFGNFFFDFERRTVTILDFDDCAWGWLVMDIAMNLLDALVLYHGQDRSSFARRFLGSYLPGYRAENPLTPAWVDRLPLFLKLLEIGLYLQVADSYDPQDPDSWIGRFMSGRKESLQQGLPFVAL
jgi:amicoumacin kinase